MATPTHWDAETLWQNLVPVLPGISVEVLPEVDSTNTRLLQRGADSAPCLLVAEHQTQGRGRMGRQWLSAAGASLTFSLGLPLAHVRWEGLSLAVGLALAQALEPLQAGQTPRLMLKWPNDLWLVDKSGSGGRKLGGVLVETALRGGQRYCVVGVGLNVHPQSAAAAANDATLTHGYACLQELTPGLQAPQALAHVALPLVLALQRFANDGFAPLLPDYAARDLLRGQAVITSATPPLQGQALGVDGDGALLLQAADGVQHRVHSGEVSVRLQGMPPARPTAESA